MLNLKEWNESFEYARETCKILKDEGYNVIPEPYTLYDGEKGIYLQVFDNDGYLFAKYATGVQKDLPNMKYAIEQVAVRIKRELQI